MIIGVLSLRNNRYHPNRRLLEAAETAGHRVVLMHPAKIYLEAGRILKMGTTGKRVAPDAVLPRIGSTIKEYPLTVIHQMELMGIRVVNTHKAVSLARNKFKALQVLAAHEVPMPFSVYASNPVNLKAALRRLPSRPFVVKTAQGRQGRGVFLARNEHEAEDLLRSTRTDAGQGLLCQEYIPPERRAAELRVLVIGPGVAAAMTLKPRPGEFRSNFHLGGVPEGVNIPEKAARIALSATRALGLEISGIDMVQDTDGSYWVLDVNYSPGFRGLEMSTGRDIASEIIHYVTFKTGRSE